MSEPASGIIPATSYGDPEPPAPRAKPKEKARAKGAATTPSLDASGAADSGADEIEKHELDTMA
jgi:hypothetical protein